MFYKNDPDNFKYLTLQICEHIKLNGDSALSDRKHSDLREIIYCNGIQKNHDKLNALKKLELKKLIMDFVNKRLESYTLNRYDLLCMNEQESLDFCEENNIYVNVDKLDKQYHLFNTIVKSKFWKEYLEGYRYVEKKNIVKIPLKSTSIEKYNEKQKYGCTIQKYNYIENITYVYEKVV